MFERKKSSILCNMDPTLSMKRLVVSHYQPDKNEEVWYFYIRKICFQLLDRKKCVFDKTNKNIYIYIYINICSNCSIFSLNKYYFLKNMDSMQELVKFVYVWTVQFWAIMRNCQPCGWSFYVVRVQDQAKHTLDCV